MSAEDEFSRPPPNSRRRWSDLAPRLLSAAILLVVTAVALNIGGYVFAAIVGLVFAGAYREWETMVTLKPLSPVGGVLIALVALSAVSFPLWGIAGTAGFIVAAAIVALAARGDAALWRAGGLVYFGLVIVAVLSMRGTAPLGVSAGIYLGAVIWLTDTGAFFTGRQVGGEKLAPDISPSKTWSGAIGGLVLGVIGGTVAWAIFAPSPWWIGSLLAVPMSILGQLGDLSESALKRRFRVKDSGDIIPGHGGIMDRLDSVTFGVIFLFVVGALHADLADVAAGFLQW